MAHKGFTTLEIIIVAFVVVTLLVIASSFVI